MTIVLFDHEYQVVAESTPVQKVKPFDRRSYAPRGATALLDAVGRTIDDTGKRFARLPEEKRPGRVLFVILTDGHENASTVYTYDRVATIVKHQAERYGWTFLYLSADIDAFDHASRLNIGTSVYFTSSPHGTRRTYNIASTAARQYRASGAAGMSIMDSCVDINEAGDVSVVSGDADASDLTDSSTTD